MAGAARSKIDRQTMQMFDAEVDVPQHDEILTTLFNSEDRLRAMICQLHGIRQLATPTPDQVLPIICRYEGKKTGEISLQEAHGKIGGPPPTWKTSDPVRDLKKTIEAPLYYVTQHASRILGFADLLLSYWIPGPLSVTIDSDQTHHWHVEKRPRHIVAEVKSKWPTAGNLLRQLNLYSTCEAGAQGERIRVAIGPDSSMEDLLHAHGWRLVTFDSDLASFRLCRKPEAQKKPPASVNAF